MYTQNHKFESFSHGYLGNIWTQFYQANVNNFVNGWCVAWTFISKADEEAMQRPGKNVIGIYKQYHKQG